MNSATVKPSLARALPLIALLVALPGPAFAQVAMPDTVAGKLLGKFFEAFNSGDRTALRLFYNANFKQQPNDPNFVNQLSDDQYKSYLVDKGLVVRRIEQSGPAVIKVLANGKSDGAWTEISLFVSAQPPDYTIPATPYQIVGMGFSDRTAPTDFLPHQKLTEKQIRNRIVALMRRRVASDAFSGTVYVAKHGRPIYAKAFGLASKSWNIANRVDTKFNLASITKMFTAVAVAQLVEQGKLSYEETVGDILHDYPNKDVAGTVTVAQLLSHTSGLIGGRALAEKTPEPQNAKTISEFVAPFVNEPLSFRPGQQFDYSNAGYALLGAIIEKASGENYYDYVRDRIFKPAGMTNTGFYELDTDPPNLANGFMDGPNGSRLDNIFTLSVKGSPYGDAYSTGPDMDKFHRALTSHKLLGEPSLKMLWTGVTENPDTHKEYGFGAYIERYNGQVVISHGGGWKGVTDEFELFPELGYSVVVLSNIDDDPTAIAYKLREWLTQGVSNEVPAEAPPLDLKAEVSVAATGVVGTPITVTVTVRNDGGTAHASVVNMEIHDLNGAKADQQFNMDQKIETHEARTYSYKWIPKASGRYTINVGLFGPGWVPKYRQYPAIAEVVVK